MEKNRDYSGCDCNGYNNRHSDCNGYNNRHNWC
jgi:hypothetical protein